MLAPMRLPAPVIKAHWPSKAKDDLLDEFTFCGCLYLMFGAGHAWKACKITSAHSIHQLLPPLSRNRDSGVR